MEAEMAWLRSIVLSIGDGSAVVEDGGIATTEGFDGREKHHRPAHDCPTGQIASVTHKALHPGIIRAQEGKSETSHPQRS